MIHAKPALRAVIAAIGAASTLYAVAALGGVKEGVDAWSAGDYARAVAEWQAPAAKGDADAQFNLAQAYRLGRGVGQDNAQAETLYARAAAQGHLKAADNYGLMLFQSGRRKQAMPYVTSASERGDPRAQYLLGLAHFNGDLAPTDWVRAYALLTLANGAGLPQATPAIGEMDQYIPLEQRQQAQVLAGNIRAKSDVTRSTRMAASDLGAETTAATTPVSPAPVVAVSAPVAVAARQASTPRTIEPVNVLPSIASAEAAVAEAVRATGTESPVNAGADFAQAKRAPAATSSAPSASKPAAAAASAGTRGPWKLQLGAFSVAGNAERAWSQQAGKAPLAGKAKQLVPAGRVTRLLAAGWPTQASAQSACTALKAGGADCIVTR